MSDYDAFAQDFSATRQRDWPEFEVFYPLLQKNDRILDLGCGNGRLRNYIDPQLIPMGNYFGFDMSEELLNIARREHVGDHFFKGDFAQILPFGADNFETIVGIASFHHLLSKSDQKQCLAELHRVLKPGGKLMLTTWNIPQKHFYPNLKRKDFWLSGWKNYLVPFGPQKHPRYYRLVTAADLAKLLKKAGFRVIKTKEFPGRNWVVVAENF